MSVWYCGGYYFCGCYVGAVFDLIIDCIFIFLCIFHTSFYMNICKYLNISIGDHKLQATQYPIIWHSGLSHSSGLPPQHGQSGSVGSP